MQNKKLQYHQWQTNMKITKQTINMFKESNAKKKKKLPIKFSKLSLWTDLNPRTILVAWRGEVEKWNNSNKSISSFLVLYSSRNKKKYQFNHRPLNHHIHIVSNVQFTLQNSKTHTKYSNSWIHCDKLEDMLENLWWKNQSAPHQISIQLYTESTSCCCILWTRVVPKNFNTKIAFIFHCNTSPTNYKYKLYECFFNLKKKCPKT